MNCHIAILHFQFSFCDKKLLRQNSFNAIIPEFRNIDENNNFSYFETASCVPHTIEPTGGGSKYPHLDDHSTAIQQWTSRTIKR